MEQLYELASAEQKLTDSQLLPISQQLPRWGYWLLSGEGEPRELLTPAPKPEPAAVPPAPEAPTFPERPEARPQEVAYGPVAPGGELTRYVPLGEGVVAEVLTGGGGGIAHLRLLAGAGTAPELTPAANSTASARPCSSSCRPKSTRLPT